MYPILFQAGDFSLPTWHVLFVVGAIAAYLIFIKLAQNTKRIDVKDAASLFLVCYISGYFGARLFAIFVEEEKLQSIGDFFSRVFTFGPMTFYGGFIASIVFGIAFCRLKKIDPWSVSDIALPSGLFALAIGRVGCFFNGDDYGLPVPEASANAWWAVTFPNHPTAVARYPVQLLETGIVTLIAGLAIFFAVRFRNLIPGLVGLSSVAFYALFRFFLEYLRGDPRGFMGSDMFSPAQQLSIALLLIADGMILYRATK